MNMYACHVIKKEKKKKSGYFSTLYGMLYAWTYHN